MFAYTNDDVDQLNAALRAVRKAARRARRRITSLTTRARPRALSPPATASSSPAPTRRPGIYNGAAGTIEAIDGTQLARAARRPTAARPSPSTPRTSSNSATAMPARSTTARAARSIKPISITPNTGARPRAMSRLTRHREKAELFVARNTARDVKQLARQMARTDDRRAASMFHHKLDIAPQDILSPAAVLAAIAPDFGATAPGANEPQRVHREAAVSTGAAISRPVDGGVQRPAGGIVGAFTRMAKIIGGLLGRDKDANVPHESATEAPADETIHAAATSDAAERGQGRGPQEQEKDPYLAAILAAREAELNNQDEQEPEREAFRERPRKRGRSLFSPGSKERLEMF